jgi:hypothetical protein
MIYTYTNKVAGLKVKVIADNKYLADIKINDIAESQWAKTGDFELTETITKQEFFSRLYEKAKKQKSEGKINFDTWESDLFKFTDNGMMTAENAKKIDKLIGLNIY